MRILLADDHALVLDVIKAHIERSLPDADVVTTSDAPGVMRLMAEEGPEAFDLILTDLQMPGMQPSEGPSGLERIVAAAEGVPVAVISGTDDNADAYACISAGAVGFVPKTMPGNAIVHAIRLMVEGATYFPAAIVAEGPPPSPDGVPSGFDGPVGDPDGLLTKLTPREAAILPFLIDGLSNKEIARNLGVEEVTIKLHLRKAFRKLGVKNRTQAARKATQLGVVANSRAKAQAAG